MHTAETTKQLEAALQTAKADFQLEVYPKASHGFAVGDTAVFDSEASERHWAALLAVFSRALR